ncbi:MAG: hypothetical protein Q8N91_06180 [Candidatus Omnitrophota bacterium]|nr:hypothetical protein [Candidatus Omnitrophota bacterium]
MISFIAGIFIDLDHIIDHYINNGFTLNPNAVYDACIDIKFKTLYLVFHSYEIVILLWIAIYCFSLSNAWKALAIGITQHVIFDNLTNPMRKLGYFFTYRALKRFRKDLLIRNTSKG